MSKLLLHTQPVYNVLLLHVYSKQCTVITYTTCIQCTLTTASILDLCLQLVIWSNDVGDCLIWYVRMSVGLVTSLVISNLLMSVGHIPYLYWAMVHGDVM